MPQIQAECVDCKASGLYTSAEYARGEAKPCHTCKGTGCHTITYTPFTRKKIRGDVQTVFVNGVGMSLREYLGSRR